MDLEMRCVRKKRSQEYAKDFGFCNRENGSASYKGAGGWSKFGRDV